MHGSYSPALGTGILVIEKIVERTYQNSQNLLLHQKWLKFAQYQPKMTSLAKKNEKGQKKIFKTRIKARHEKVQNFLILLSF